MAPRTKFSHVGLGLLCILLFFAPRVTNGQEPRAKLLAAKIEPRVGHALPLDVEFENNDGGPVRLREILGKRPVVLCLVYFECPMLCKLAADGLVRSVSSLTENIGEDFDVVFLSFDPRDNSARADAARKHALGQYNRAGTEGGWHFLTGRQASIDAVTQAVGFQYVWDEDTKQFSHATGLMIISPMGVISEYVDGVNFSPKDLASAIKRAKHNELTERESFSFVRCYMYDPTTGKLGSAVQWTIRGLGLATVLLITIGITRMNRLSKKSLTNAEDGLNV